MGKLGCCLSCLRATAATAWLQAVSSVLAPYIAGVPVSTLIFTPRRCRCFQEGGVLTYACQSQENNNSPDVGSIDNPGSHWITVTPHNLETPLSQEEDFEVISRDLLVFPLPSCIIALREGHTNIALCCCTTDTEQHSPSPSWAGIAAATGLVVVARRRVQKSRRHSTRRFITDHPFRALAPKSDLSALRNKRFASRDILE